MSRLHIHVSVDDLKQAISFYSTLFGAEPAKEKPDYAKWMLDNPHVNFAISARGGKPGVNHLGFQADDESELSSLRARFTQADLQTFDEGEVVCCYAKSDKTWLKDPVGIGWEVYHTMSDANLYHSEQNPQKEKTQSTACCSCT